MLAKSKLNSVEVLISKALTELNISCDEFVLINNVLKELYKLKKEIKNSNCKIKFTFFIKTMLSYYFKCRRKNTESKNPKIGNNNNGRIILLSKCAVCKTKK